VLLTPNLGGSGGETKKKIYIKVVQLQQSLNPPPQKKKSYLC